MDRYCELLSRKTEDYFKVYQELKTITDCRVVVGIHCIDVKNLRVCINSLLDQTVRVEQLILVTTTDEKIPSDMVNYVKHYRSNDIYKASVVLTPLLYIEKNPDTIIITLTDRIIYGKEHIERLLRAYMYKPNRAVVCSKRGDSLLVKVGFFAKDTLTQSDIQTRDSIVKFLHDRKQIDTENINYINIIHRTIPRGRIPI